MGVTIREVAKEAGVSTAAVSKVLHGRGTTTRVSEERAQRIRETAKRLGYHPNAIARSLRRGSTHTVGLFCDRFDGLASGPLYYPLLLDGLASSLFPGHYRLTIVPETHGVDVRADLCDGRLDGAIWCRLARDEETMEIIHSCPIPIVAVNAPPTPEVSEAVFVACDNMSGVCLALEHLAELGHRRVLFAQEREEEATPDCAARREAFLKLAPRFGLKGGEESVQNWTRGAPEFDRGWHRRSGYTAIFAWNERLGAEILSRAQALGVPVPHEISVVGFDSTAFCDTTTPRLTAVRQPIREMAAHAGDLLLSLIAGQRPEHYSSIFPCTLDVRGSTAIPSMPKEAAQ
jgi:LacI family transcriptional regulator